MTATFRRVAKGFHRNAETGVEIHQGESGNWFVYTPKPGTSAKDMAGSRKRLAEAKVIGEPEVAAILARRVADHAEALAMVEQDERAARNVGPFAEQFDRWVARHGHLACTPAARLAADHAEALLINDPEVAERAPEPQSVAANSERYFTHGCGADVQATTARLVAQDQARRVSGLSKTTADPAPRLIPTFDCDGYPVTSTVVDPKAVSNVVPLRPVCGAVYRDGTLIDWTCARPPHADDDGIGHAVVRFPEGTPEYTAYAAEIRTELDKFASGEPPYEYYKDPLFGPTAADAAERVVRLHSSALTTDADPLGYALIADRYRREMTSGNHSRVWCAERLVRELGVTPSGAHVILRAKSTADLA